MKDCKEQQFDAARFVDSFYGTFDRVAGNANFHGLKPLPQMTVIGQIANEFLELMFPGRCKRERSETPLLEIISQQMNNACSLLKGQLFLAYRYENPSLDDCKLEEKADEITQQLCHRLPQIRISLKLDARAAFEGDPAARNLREIILSYPCIKTLTVHRIAHQLFLMDVPLIPRMLNEYAHAETGIDIHPGARIGNSFFIDHGTGVVIGETTVIGDHVKIYQGVTLGALSFPKDACGTLIRGAKRHPTIEDNVTIYSNATILGDVTIGKNAIVGSNVWIKESVSADTMVMIQEPKITFRELKKRSAH